jgi:hypothetical protein
MPTLPTKTIRALAPFAPLFSGRVCQHAQVLLAGAILAPAQRTVGSALRAMGLDQEKRFHRYHRVLSRASWSSREASRVLLGLLAETFVPEGPLVLGIDETLERRRGKKIAAKGIYRDPVRSSHTHFVKASGLRWICVTLLAEVPWAGRVWALPFLSALAYSERYAQELGKKPHKKLTDWAWQLLSLVRRWHPQRKIVAVADSTYSSLKLLDRCRRLSNPITFITRLRLDAALYEPAPPRYPGQIGRPRLKGERLANLSVIAQAPSTAWKTVTLADWYGKEGRTVEVVSSTAVWHSTGLPAVPLRWVLIRDPQEEFDAQALLCTDLSADPERIISWFVRRWQMEATFQEVRKHLGFETQRQWAERAIRRTAPALLGLFSLVALFAHQQRVRVCSEVRRTAWYDKRLPTFADALALARKELWSNATFCRSLRESETVKVPRAFVERLTDAVCYAA